MSTTNTVPVSCEEDDEEDDEEDMEDSMTDDVKLLPPMSRTSFRTRYRRKWNPVILCGIVVVVAVLVVCCVLIGVFASSGGGSTPISTRSEICGNPPLLLISLDGFLADYLARSLTPNLQNMIDNGVKASHMRSSFPTLTFPNHYSIVTGLYPESHGIVSNTFYDTQLKEKFSISDSTHPQWWDGEPVWVTAEKNKLISGIYFWPGSETEIEGHKPTYFFPYNGSTPYIERVDTILQWLDLHSSKRPQFMALYISEPDHTAHKYGPDSQEVNDKLSVVDKVVGRLWEGLLEREISKCVNIMVVSDHGMSELNESNVVNISSLLPENLTPDPPSDLYAYPAQGTTLSINIENNNETAIYDSLVENGVKMENPFRVFKVEDLPLRLHAGHFNKQRYGPLYLIGDDHSILFMFIGNNRPNTSIGNHGYDNIEKTMQALFVAHGPAFKEKYVSEPFENIQLYSLMCDLLKITAAPNNGTSGSLYHILKPSVAKKLPPAEAPRGSPGVNQTCDLPMDNETFVNRSICEACVCNCSDNATTILEGNRMNFDLTTAQKLLYKDEHFPWGVPNGGRGKGACLLTQPNFVHLYSNTLRIPLLVGYTVNATGVVESPVSSLCIRTDPRVDPSNSPNCSLYDDNTADLHNWCGPDDILSPVSWVLPTNAYMDHDISRSVLSALTPLCSEFETNVLQPLYRIISNWLRTYSLNIMIGSVLDADRDGRRDEDSAYPRVRGVALPSHVFVVVTRCNEESEKLMSCSLQNLDALGMVFQHPLGTGDYSDPDRVLRYSLTPLRDIERLTGFDFFPNLTETQMNVLELRLANELWPANIKL